MANRKSPKKIQQAEAGARTKRRRAPAKVDAITLRLVQNHLSTYADEMANTVMRTAYSTIVRDAMDYSTALCDRNGQTVAQGLTIPFHLGSIHFALAHVIRKYEPQIYPGDVFILNDPFDGGIHLPDIFLFKPVFYKNERIGFAAVVTHHVDVGGRVPGSSACDSTEVFQEGLRIPALKLYDRGKPSDELFQILEKNVRVPAIVLGDIHANLAGLRTGEKGFVEIAERYGTEDLKLYLEELLNYTEKMMRAEIRTWPEGEYEFTDYMDEDGVTTDSIPFHVKITVRGDSLVVDFEGTSRQVRGALNSPAPFSKSATGYAIRSVMQSDIPHTAGIFRALDIKLPAASIVNPVMPAASSMRGVTGFRMVDTILGALAQIVPDRVPAAGEGGNSLAFIGGYTEEGEAFVMSDLIAGTWGGRPVNDGNDGLTNPASVVSNIPAELMELEYPVHLEQYALVPDTGGAGKHRGGLAIVRDWRITAPEATVSTRSDRRKHPPYGLQGGYPGAPSWFIVNPDTTPVVRGTKDSFQLKNGDLLRHITAGGGGWGEPLDRDPEKVLLDVRNEKVSPEKARELYGVVVDAQTAEIDGPATQLLRTEMRNIRGNKA